MYVAARSVNVLIAYILYLRLYSGRSFSSEVSFFFFFQAEDGIRDLTVTGVQTCALPISDRRGDREDAGRQRVARRPWSCRPLPPVAARSRPASSRSPRRSARASGRSPPRSEERRVGKEGRSRWSPHHLKKKNTTRKLACE